MTRIPELLAAGPTLSFEFSAPRDPEGVTRLERTLGRLAELKPAFMSVTYGAGGATRGPTREWVSRIREVHGVEAMPHLTCVSHTRAEVAAIVDSYAADGIENLLALRGDLPSGGGELPSSEAFAYARELAEFVRERAAMSIGVAAHPEGHPLAVSAEADRAHQAAKIGAADFALTQFFFDAEHYWRFVEEMAARGVERPIIPGLMPPTNVAGIARMSELNGIAFPAAIRARLTAAGEDLAARRAIGVEAAVGLGRELLEGGIFQRRRRSAGGAHLHDEFLGGGGGDRGGVGVWVGTWRLGGGGGDNVVSGGRGDPACSEDS